MSQRQIPLLRDSTAATVLSDTGSSANTLVERDPSNDIYGNSFRGDGPAYISAAEYRDPSVSKTTSFTVDDTKDLWPIDATGGDVTATLPAASTCRGLRLTFKLTSATNHAVIDGNGTETIDGATTKTITTQYGFLTVECDGTKWHIISSGGTIT